MSSDEGALDVRVCNLGPDPITLYENQTVGTFDAAEVVEDEEGAECETTEFHISDELTEKQLQRVRELLAAHQSSFSAHEFDLGTTSFLKHEIHLEPGSRPIKQKQRIIPLGLRQQVDDRISEMRRHGIIELSRCPAVGK